MLAAADLAGVLHLVHMSSLGVYSPGPTPLPGTAPELRPRVDEAWPRDGVPTLAYSRHKAAVERMLDDYQAGVRGPERTPVLTSADIAGALGARQLHLPAWALRTVLGVSWHARLQPLDPGWLDLAYAVPLTDVGRARDQLGWKPTVDARGACSPTWPGRRPAAWSRTAG